MPSWDFRDCGHDLPGHAPPPSSGLPILALCEILRRCRVRVRAEMHGLPASGGQAKTLAPLVTLPMQNECRHGYPFQLGPYRSDSQRNSELRSFRISPGERTAIGALFQGSGEVAERPIVQHWKCCVLERGPGVRIPPSPLIDERANPSGWLASFCEDTGIEESGFVLDVCWIESCCCGVMTDLLVAG